jgi:hypothetical protein
LSSTANLTIKPFSVIRVLNMPLKQFAKFFAPETLTVMEHALERACRELTSDGDGAVAALARRDLAKTIVALAAVGETDLAKLEKFALQAYRSAQKVSCPNEECV